MKAKTIKKEELKKIAEEIKKMGLSIEHIKFVTGYKPTETTLKYYKER